MSACPLLAFLPARPPQLFEAAVANRRSLDDNPASEHHGNAAVADLQASPFEFRVLEAR